MTRITNFGNKSVVFQGTIIESGKFADFNTIYDYNSLCKLLNSGKVMSKNIVPTSTNTEKKDDSVKEAKTITTKEETKTETVKAVEDAPKIVEDKKQAVTVITSNDKKTKKLDKDSIKKGDTDHATN